MGHLALLEARISIGVWIFQVGISGSGGSVWSGRSSGQERGKSGLGETPILGN
jgi:hypothetical protein